MFNNIYTKLLPKIIYLLYKIYFSTIKFNYSSKRPSFPCIFAHFHQDEISLINTGKNSKYCVMTSYSKDGELMTNFLKQMGYSCVRGSSSKKGGSGFLAMLNFCKKNLSSAVLAVDGPRGPIYKVKKGVILLAIKTKYPIIALVASCNSYFQLKKAWNKAIIPKPFSTVNIMFGDALYINDDDNMDEQALVLEKQLKTLKNIN